MHRFSPKHRVVRALLPTTILIGVLLVCGHLFHLSRVDRNSSNPEFPVSSSRSSRVERDADEHPDGRTGRGRYKHSHPGEYSQRTLHSIDAAWSRISSGISTKETLAVLIELRKVLASGSRKAGAEALLEFLKSGKNASTGLPFHLNNKGFLDHAPTLRVFAYDQLGSLDPNSAREYGYAVLDSKDSVAEWAIALRSIGKLMSPREASSNVYFLGKLEDLLGYDPWLEDPSMGFLQSFDAVVYSGNPALAARLAYLINDASTLRAVRYAATLALDRMVLDQFRSIVPYLRRDPELLSAYPKVRANLLARGDLRIPEERVIVENYLLDETASEAELAYIVRAFPNANMEISYNLLTRPKRSTISDLIQHDRSAYAVVVDWKSDARFSHIAQKIEVIESRLKRFLESAERGRQQTVARNNGVQ